MKQWQAQYRRWHGESVGVWSRRLSIARYGLRLCLANKVLKVFLAISLIPAVIFTAVFFLFGQIVAPDSILIRYLESLGGQKVSDLIGGVAAWALLYPEICVDGIYRLAFFTMKFNAPWFSLVIVALFVHRLIANDLASQAIVIYNSKALTRFDYLIGKFAIVATILSVVWIVPVVVSWFLGNLLSPDWSFFYYSFPSLLRALFVGVVAVFTLSSLALAISSFAKKTGAAVAYWILGWLCISVVSGILSLVHPSLLYLDPIAGIMALGTGVFRMESFMNEAQEMLPFFSGFVSNLEGNGMAVSDGSILQPLLCLLILGVASLYIVNKRVTAS